MPNVVDSIMAQPLAEYALGYRKHREDKYADFLRDSLAYQHAGDWDAGAKAAGYGEGFVKDWMGHNQGGLPYAALFGQTPQDETEHGYSPSKKTTLPTDKGSADKPKKEVKFDDPKLQNFHDKKSDDLWEEYQRTYPDTPGLQMGAENDYGKFDNPLDILLPKQFGDPYNYGFDRGAANTAEMTATERAEEAAQAKADPRTYFNSVLGLPQIDYSQPLPQINANPLPKLHKKKKR
jgi:hypothetical protein